MGFKGWRSTAALAISLGVGSVAVAGGFTPGNIVVARVVGGSGSYTPGNGGATGHIDRPTALTGNTAATVVLNEYTPAGVLVQEVPFYNFASSQARFWPNAYITYYGFPGMTLTGAQNTEGQLALSGDGRSLVMAGYNQYAGSSPTNAQPSSVTIDVGANDVVNRVVSVVNLADATASYTRLTDVSSNQAVRSAYSRDGTGFFVSGGNGGGVYNPYDGTTHSTAGVRYGVVYGAPQLGTNQVSAVSDGNARALNGFNGDLYLSSTSPNASTRGISRIGPTTLTDGPVTPTQLPGFGTTDYVAFPQLRNERADDFWFADAKTLYVADSRNGVASTVDNLFGGVQKFRFNSATGQWEFQYSLQLGLSDSGSQTLVGAHGLSGMIDPVSGLATLYVTTFDGNGAAANRLRSVVDTGTSLLFGTMNILAPANGGFDSAFRGVEVLPVPEPCLAMAGLAALLLRRRPLVRGVL